MFKSCFAAGDKVKAKLPSLGKFFTATVDSVNKDGTYNVTFQVGLVPVTPASDCA